MQYLRHTKICVFVIYLKFTFNWVPYTGYAFHWVALCRGSRGQEERVQIC